MKTIASDRLNSFMLEKSLSVRDVAEYTGSSERSVQGWRVYGMPEPKFELLQLKAKK
jgi:hypothetical protein